jgi:pimeloyl-ACP methyl ester carboxylesterase
MIHGYRRQFRLGGDGSPILLIHGIGDNSQAWNPVIRQLAMNHLVIAPDLLGHGGSDKPRADYSVAAYANGMRDLLSVLDVDRVTIVGHSLGGGVAMQFAYQFPERTERLVLVSSGGAGRGVSPALRLATLPGALGVLSLLKVPGAQQVIESAIAGLRLFDTDLAVDAPHLQRVVSGLPDYTARSAFIRTLRAVVDWRGQVVTMLDRCYLANGMPTQLVWGSRDSVLPVGHAHQAHHAMPGSRLAIFDGAGHFPYHSDPERFVAIIEEFISTTPPSDWDDAHWRELLRRGRPRGTVPAPAERDHLQLVSERSAT